MIPRVHSDIVVGFEGSKEFRRVVENVNTDHKVGGRGILGGEELNETA